MLACTQMRRCLAPRATAPRLLPSCCRCKAKTSDTRRPKPSEDLIAAGRSPWRPTHSSTKIRIIIIIIIIIIITSGSYSNINSEIIITTCSNTASSSSSPLPVKGFFYPPHTSTKQMNQLDFFILFIFWRKLLYSEMVFFFGIPCNFFLSTEQNQIKYLFEHTSKRIKIKHIPNVSK